MTTSRDRQQAEDIDGDAGADIGRLETLIRRAATFYLGQIAMGAARDRAVGQKLFEVVNLRTHPNALIADPRILARVVWARFRQRLAPTLANRDETPDHPPAPE